jgi:hypothetical protein
MWHAGQAADTASRSSEVSCAQPSSSAGKAVPPRWSALRKQPLSVVQAGSPYCAVHGEVGLGVRVAERVDDGDGLARADCAAG